MADATVAKKPRRRGRPTALSADERRERILDALGGVFDQGGLENLTMDAVARAAGMSKRTLYELFADRAALFEAYFQRLSSTFVRELPADAADLPLADRLALMLAPRPIADSALPLAILRAVVAEAPERPDMACAFHRKARGRILSMVEAEIARAMQRGELPPVDPALAATVLCDMVKPNALDHLLNPATRLDLEAREARFRFALAVFLNGIAAAPAADGSRITL
ncbi:MAG: TetR/AcrR family transcriptional regulator [Rhodobacteraceae bacterium]|nr:TetR/AcrR family transcriptional regulator [Paracoccaceae bacterium]